MSELYRPSDRRLSAKLVPTFADREMQYTKCIFNLDKTPMFRVRKSDLNKFNFGGR
jgi:hypothetical protein